MRRILSHPAPENVPFSVDSQSINKVVGQFAIGLPVVLPLVVWLNGGRQMPSISHYYYTPVGGDILVGMLSIIGVILIMFYRYKGFQAEVADKVRDGDREANSANNLRNALLAKLAGLAALGVAFIPTEGWVPIDAEGTLPGFLPDRFVGLAHSLSAGVMFCILGYFSAFVFTRVQSKTSTVDCRLDSALTARKIRRNRWYRGLGMVIFGAVFVLLAKSVAVWLDPKGGSGWLGIWNGARVTFWVETAALLAFGLSWMIKGRRFSWLNDDPHRCKGARQGV
ncbi:MAG TPA: hypothetical protein ENK28_09245 [Aliiroseovarius sp.]|nr:hypothetical protein [Aliiroseovarius sp.]